jgi:hypothetical protein
VNKWLYLKPEEIIGRFNDLIRGILDFYYEVDNRNKFSYILWILKFSAVFTLARKLNISTKQVWKTYGNPITINYIVKGGGEEKRSIKLYEPTTLGRIRTFKLGK